VPYFVKAPKEERFDKFLSYFLKKVGEGEDYAIYMGIDDLPVSLSIFKHYGIDKAEVPGFYRAIRVEGGYKRLDMEGDLFLIAPSRRKIFTVRLSPDEYNLLVEDAKEMGRTPSDWARELVMKLVREYLAQEKWKAILSEIEETCKGCVYWVDEACRNPEIPKDYRGKVFKREIRTCEYKTPREAKL